MSCFIHRGAWIHLLPLALAVALLPNLAAAQTGSISGTVTGPSAVPLQSVTVSIYKTGGIWAGSATTNASGQYTVSGLAAGTYWARTTNSLGYIEQLWQNIPCTGCNVTSLGTAITVTAGTTHSGIDFSLTTQGGSITGTVRIQAGGTALSDVQVEAFTSTGAYINNVFTNGSGQYTLGGLEAGTYYVRTTYNSQGYVNQLYYNISCGGCTVTSGTGISVTLGATHSGIDFALELGGSISGTVTGTGGAPVQNVQVSAYNSSGVDVSWATTNASGQYTVSGLPSGTYYARTSNSLGYIDQLYNGISCASGCTVTSGTGIAVTAGGVATANFSLVLGFTLTVSKAGTGSGTVTSSPAGIACGTTCDAMFASGTVVTLTGTPATGSAFWGWSGDADCSDGSVTMTAARNCTATFGPPPTLAASPSSLQFGAVNSSGGTLTSKTGSQDVTLTQTGSGTVTWTATSDQPWLQVSSASGTGTGRFTVSVISSAALPASGTVTGTITVTASGAQSNPTVAVSMTLYTPTTATSPAFGQIDTPSQSAAGVQGAIGVTGWALDDVGVASVKIYRNCLSFENQANCQTISGYNVVYIGDAAFVAGARPDVETAFSSYPQAYRGGWGYLMLTNMLPDVVNSQAYGGQGSLTLYVYATDAEGNVTLLGRTQTDHAPTSITMANATIAKPFGAIDTPTQGGTVSGTYANFGWALTPDSNTSADATDILIPTDGSTAVVFIDGISTALVAYNQCRGDVGNPVPAGVYCNDDVANIFGNTTPQATLTTRTSNPTKHRNLDAGRSAIGAYDINTTLLTNGLHSIAWSVTDSQSRTEGIGSRNFIVLNGSSDEATVQALVDAPAKVLGQVTDVTWRPLGTGGVWGRAGFDLRAAWETIEADAAGTRHVRMPELGRLELSLGPGVTTGYLMVNGTLRSLPVGSQVTDGHFTWVPPVGFLGTYDLVFLNGIEQLPVSVTIYGASKRPSIQAYIDLPHAGETVSGTFFVAGWAADTTAWNGTGIGAVHVWAHRRDADVPAVFLGAAELNGWRPDVGVAIGAQFERAGWTLTAPALPPGEYDLVAYFWSTKTQRFEDARVVRVSVR